MPVIAGDHQGVFFLLGRQLGNLFFGLAAGFLFQFLAAAIELVEFLGEFLAGPGIGREQQIQSIMGTIDPARGIETGTQLEADIHRVAAGPQTGNILLTSGTMSATVPRATRSRYCFRSKAPLSGRSFNRA